MKAIQLRAIYGEHLIGKQVFTEAIGEYPGGEATIIELSPDPAAPEIVFSVNHPTFGPIGIFEEETCDLLAK